MDPAAGGVAECLWNALAQVDQGHTAASRAANGTGLHANGLEKFN
jgi:hypothetical protein